MTAKSTKDNTTEATAAIPDNSVHFVLQGKGGVGKSLISTMIAQYLQSKGLDVVCADTDPVNATFTQYKSLNVAHLEIADGTRISQRKFDELVERIATTEGHFVIDNGAATFLPLTEYIAENGIFDLLKENGKNVFIHTILTAGQAKLDTLNGFAELAARATDAAKIVVWENEFWGAVDYDGDKLQSLKVFQEAASKVAGIVKLVNRGQSDTFPVDIKMLSENHWTLTEALQRPEFNLVSRTRLKTVFRDVFSELDRVAWQ